MNEKSGGGGSSSNRGSQLCRRSDVVGMYGHRRAVLDPETGRGRRRGTFCRRGVTDEARPNTDRPDERSTYVGGPRSTRAACRGPVASPRSRSPPRSSRPAVAVVPRSMTRPAAEAAPRPRPRSRPTPPTRSARPPNPRPPTSASPRTPSRSPSWRTPARRSDRAVPRVGRRHQGLGGLQERHRRGRLSPDRGDRLRLQAVAR